MALVASCCICGQPEAFPITQAGKHYCSKACLAYESRPKEFCAQCIANTTDEAVKSRGGLAPGELKGLGPTIRPQKGSPPCPACGSVVVREAFLVLRIPVWFGGMFRALYLAPARSARYRTRKVKQTPL
jgi:hypothetical protein